MTVSIAGLAAELPMASHPGQKAAGLDRSPFVAPAVKAAAIGLAYPPELLAKEGAGKAGAPENRVGLSRRPDLDALPPGSLAPDWTAVDGGFVARYEIRSAGAARVRVGLLFGLVPDGLEIRVAGTGGEPLPELLTAQWVRETYGAAPGLLWTPSTAGETQQVELFVPGAARPAAAIGAIQDVSHLFVDPFLPGPMTSKDAKLLECHQNYSCSTDATLASAGKAVARMVYTSSSGGSFVCTGALVNDAGNVRRYFATAYHCIASQSEAASIQFGWFYERQCGLTSFNPAFVTTQGAQLLRANRDNDFTFLQLTGSIPAGTTLLGWSSTALASGSSVFGIHHPAGEWKAFSLGGSTGRQTRSALLGAGDVLTITGNGVSWSSGLTEPGSSGSPLMTGAGVLRGTLSMGPRNQTCSTTRESTYSDFSLAYPLVQQWLNPGAAPSDDYPDSAAAASGSTALDNTFLKVQLNSATDEDWFKFTFAQPGVWILYSSAEPGAAAVDTVGRIYAGDGTTLLQENDDDPLGAFGENFAFYLRVNSPGTYYLRVTGFLGATGRFELNSIYDPNDDHSDLAFLGTPLAPGQTIAGSLEAAGDGDYFILDLAQGGQLTLSSSGSTDLVGVLRDASLNQIALNDDTSATNLNFRVSANVAAGRYYLQVVGFDVQTTGPYSVTASLAGAGATNYTGLWWAGQAESGWGINTNHQGDVLFATLFTYASDGASLWLVATNMARQPDGSFTGALFRTTGPPYFTTPWTSIAANQVGTMTWRFSSATAATLTYTFEGRTVVKNVVRQDFATPVPTCTSTTASRASETNYQDLWWGGPSESGWGLNLTHQGNTIFGTLFTYTLAGRDGWLFSAMARQGDGSFTGQLYVASGPPYFTLPWTPIATTELGTMTFRPTAGDRGTLTYNVGSTQVVKNILRQDFSQATRPVCR